jgi:hypothetical protein
MADSRTKTPVDRNIKQGGLMTKDVGQQASYGVPYESAISVTGAKSLKPRKKTIKRIEDQCQLRMDVKMYTPGSFFLRVQKFYLLILTTGSNPSHQLCTHARVSSPLC